MKATENTPQPGWSTAELVGIMFDHYRKKVILNSVIQATMAGQEFAQMLKALCEMSGLTAREVGMVEAVDSLERLMKLVQKLKAANE